MSVSTIPVSSQAKKPFHHRNGSDELGVFEAARYFSGATENNSFSGTHESRSFNYNTRPFGRMSLDMPNLHRGNGIPLQAMLMENRMVINKEKKSKQPSSPGGKLAHFLNSLFKQTSSKKSKSKTKSTKDEDESPSSWRRKRRSSISHFRSANTTTTTTITATATATTTATIMSDAKSPFSTSTSSGFRTPPPYHVAHTPTKTTSYKDPKSYTYLKPLPTQITKVPINGNLNKIEHFTTKSDLSDKNMSYHNGLLEKAKIYDEKHEQQQHHHHHLHKYVLREDIKEFKKFVVDDGADSDSSSDLFELTNCDLGYYSSGLPVYETTRMDNIKK